MTMEVRRRLVLAVLLDGALLSLALWIIWRVTPRVGGQGSFAEAVPWVLRIVVTLCLLACLLITRNSRAAITGAAVIMALVGLAAAMYGEGTGDDRVSGILFAITAIGSWILWGALSWQNDNKPY
jgi:hypothetical protein